MRPLPLIAMAVLALLGWRTLSLGMADHYADTQPERALFWRADHPQALFRLAEQQAAAKRWPQAESSAQAALRANRLDGRAFRILAQVAEASGQAGKARALYRQAVHWAPRDVPSHLWLFQNALRRRDAEVAIRHMDALFRLRPALLAPMRLQAEVLAANPATRPALVKALLDAPPWRAGYLRGLGTSSLATDALAPLFEALGRKAELKPDEITPWLDRLRRENRQAQAYLTWANWLPETQRKWLGNVYDGGFELPPEEHSGPFAWRSGSPNGSLVLWTETRGTVGDSSYSVQFEGLRTPFSDLSQTLVLPPGDWLLQWRAKADDLEGPRGLIWRLRCLPGDKPLADSEAMTGRHDWRDLELAFTVPPECAAQSLVLTIPARIPAETMIDGALWLDEVRIVPAPALP